MLQIKSGAKLIGINTQIVIALQITESLWKENWPNVPVTVTCGTDGKHGQGSRHYFGNAVDIRTRDLPHNEDEETGNNSEAAKHARQLLGQRLGNEFDVVLESDHIHIEWDPKHGST